MKTILSWLVTLAILAGVAGAVYYWINTQPSPPPAPPITPNPTVSAKPTPAIKYPVPTETAKPDPSATDVVQKPLPKLDESDPTLNEVLSSLFGKSRFEALFNAKDIIRRIVVTIDTATGHKQPSAEVLPLKNPPPPFRPAGKPPALTIDPRNAARYQPYLDLLRTVDVSKLVSVYVHFYPLFQAAYRDLGTPGYFNDRMVEVIDKVLETPEPKELIALNHAVVENQYPYSDDQLEALPAVQRLLIRMGRPNATLIKNKLRQARARLVNLQL